MLLPVFTVADLIALYFVVDVVTTFFYYYLMTPKDKDSILKKVGSYVDSNATGWIMMKSILGSQLETLGRALKNV